ncbi:MAG: hypothetical protein QOH86_288, partial [Sphingomonadales bacterium]|nr:hypothetical protein [Sphingomonadales bacterium]
MRVAAALREACPDAMTGPLAILRETFGFA